MKNPVSQNIVHTGVMMQTIIVSPGSLVLQTKSDWSGLKNEKRENLILTTVSPLHTWQTAAGSELRRCSSTIWQALTVQSRHLFSSFSWGCGAGTCFIHSEWCFVVVILRWGSSGRCFTSQESDTQIPARLSGREMSTLIEQTKIRGVIRSNFMFQLWLTATDWFKSSQH